MEQNLDPQNQIYKPSSDFFKCSLCNQIFTKPITLQCGHTFCHLCLIKWIENRKINSQGQNLVSSIPFCPICETMIWRPIIDLKQNVTISALISKFKYSPERVPQIINYSLVQNPHFHIMIESQKTKNTLLPHCFSQIIFSTAFIDEILEQQSLSNFVIVRWPSQDRTLAIAGKLIRPQTYHQSIGSSRYETVFRAVFQGKFFVRIKEQQIISLKVNYHNTYNSKQEIRSPLILCQIQQIHSTNPITLQQFQPFFQIYDKLNTPAYLRQISQMVDEKVLNDRNKPQSLIYCVIRLLRFSQNEVSRLAMTMDDRERWNQIQQFLIKNSGRAAIQVIKIDIPGSYPHAFVFTILIIMLILQYLSK